MRFSGTTADVCAAKRNVCFAPESDLGCVLAYMKIEINVSGTLQFGLVVHMSIVRSDDRSIAITTNDQVKSAFH
jgi:hypothetical protein